MSPHVATLVFLVGILGLFALDRDRETRCSKALWICTLWLFFCASRPPSVWLEGSSPASSDQYAEGSPIDRAVFAGLELAGLLVLLGRRRKVGKILVANGPIILFSVYCAVSIFWSDYPEIAFKRWIKALGTLAMVLIVLTDRNPSAAVRRLLARTGFFLIPLSILFYKYIPDLGRAYAAHWEGTQFYVGVTTNKNELGMVCLVVGLGSLWRLLQAPPDGKGIRRHGPRIAHGVIFAMVVWILVQANSVTSSSCCVLAGGLMVLVNRPKIARRPAFTHLLVAGVVGFALFALFFDSGGVLLKSVGRNPTLTGRTMIWSQVISMVPNSLLGAGYDSFWLGPRLDKLWNIFPFQPNEAHNGYIEMYLQLGWIGVGLLATMIVVGYRRIIAAVRLDPAANSLRLACLVGAVIYNFTEAAFKAMHPLWLFFLWAVMAVPTIHALKASRNGQGESKQRLAEIDAQVSATTVDEPSGEVFEAV